MIDRVEEFILSGKRPASATTTEISAFLQGDTPRFAGGYLRDAVLDLAAIGPQVSAELWRQLPAQPAIRTLVIASNDLGADGITHVAQKLPGFAALEHLHWGNNHCSATGLRAVLDGLAPNAAQLQSLWMSRNEFGIHAAKLLADRLPLFSSLRALDLLGNAMGTGALRQILDAITAHPMEVLLLDGVGIDNENVISFCDAISKLTNLRAISLGGHHWSAPALQRILETLRALPRLEALALRSIALGPSSAPIVADYVRGNQQLKVLDLSYYRKELLAGVFPNNIGDEGALLLANAVDSASSLTTLNLRGHLWTASTYQRWIQMLDEHAALQSFRVDGSDHSETDAALVATMCRKRNRVGRAKLSVCDEWNRIIAPVHRHRLARVPEAAHSQSNSSPARIAAPTKEALKSAISVLTAVVARTEAGEPLTVDENTLRALLGRWNRAHRPAPTEDHRVDDRAHRNRALDAAKRWFVRERRITSSAPELDSHVAGDGGFGAYQEHQGCYGCGANYRELDQEYDRLCPSCARLNREQRTRTLDLHGCVAVVTGSRIRIGFATTLKLLRSGAIVHATTRFPNDAMRRFAELPDFHQWNSRLHIHPIDLRWLRDIEAVVATITAQTPAIDILINNAAQTIAQRAAYYQAMFAIEHEAERALPAGLKQPLLGAEVLGDDQVRAVLELGPGAAQNQGTELEVIERDNEGLPLDLRSKNSWRARVSDVSLGELVSVHAVNAMAPYALLTALRPAMRQAVQLRGDAFVVNVTSVEGQFSEHRKPTRHPHTNMTKAALNMLTRTSGDELSRERIWMNSVDPGWISPQNPANSAATVRLAGWAPPLEPADAAARILAPVADRKEGQNPVWGLLLKNYIPVEW